MVTGEGQSPEFRPGQVPQNLLQVEHRPTISKVSECERVPQCVQRSLRDAYTKFPADILKVAQYIASSKFAALFSSERQVALHSALSVSPQKSAQFE